MPELVGEWSVIRVLPAGGAQAEYFRLVAADAEPVGPGDIFRPGFNRTPIDLLGATALGTDEVMVVPLIVALSIEGFTAGDVENINGTDLGH